MELLKTLPTTIAKHVDSYDQIKDDAEAMLDMLDKGIKKGDRYANGAALHHAQVCADPFNFFVVASMYSEIFGGGRIRRVVVNGKIVDQKNLVPFQEGCLSFLDRPYLTTRRFDEIKMTYQQPRGDMQLHNPFPRELTLEGFPAFLVQHELDHANGKHIHDGQFDEYNPRMSLHKEAK